MIKPNETAVKLMNWFFPVICAALMSACSISSEDNPTTDNVVINHQKWTVTIPGGGGYVYCFRPPEKGVMIFVTDYKDESLPLGATQLAMSNADLKLQKRYEDSALSAKTIGDIETDVGRITVNRREILHDTAVPNYVVYYQVEDGRIISVGFFLQHEANPLLKIRDYLNQMYLSKRIPRASMVEH